ncbi:MAG: hypothetical protein PHI86_00045 [Candidatus Omnitrophica bacterium]|nr:hypothetical protein [Candidatus Omnitrophota bacterium]
MKYTIEGFSQEVALKLGLDAKDLILLRWIVDFHATERMEKHYFEQKEYFWVDYKTVIEDLPILDIGHKVALRRRLRNIEKSGLVEFRVFPGAGNRTFYRFKTEILASLLSNKSKGGLNPKVYTPLTQKFKGSKPKSLNPNIDPNTIDPNTNDNTKKTALEFLDYFILKTNKNLKLTPERKAIIEQRLNEGRTLEELKKAVDNFIQDDWPDRHKFIDIIYCIGIRNKVDNLDKWLAAKPKFVSKEPKPKKDCELCEGSGYVKRGKTMNPGKEGQRCICWS